MIPRYIDPVSGRYVKILNFKKVSKIRYGYKIHILSQGYGYIHSIRVSIIVTCV